MTSSQTASLGGGLAGLGHGSLPESVAEAPADSLQVAHAASSGGLPPLGLHGPVVCKWRERSIREAPVLVEGFVGFGGQN